MPENKDERELLLETTIPDWRMLEHDTGDELTGRQKEPWAVKVLRGGYDGLDLEFTDPTGRKFELDLEIDQGNITAMVRRDDPEGTYGVQDEVEAKLFLAKDGTYLHAEDPRGYRHTTLKITEGAVSTVRYEDIPTALGEEQAEEESNA